MRLLQSEISTALPGGSVRRHGLVHEGVPDGVKAALTALQEVYHKATRPLVLLVCAQQL